jgi:hypothetical protein
MRSRARYAREVGENRYSFPHLQTDTMHCTYGYGILRTLVIERMLRGGR